MTKWLYDSYSTISDSFKDDFFYSSKNEAELTKIRANYVNKSALAHCIDILDLDDYLLLGKSDEKNEVWRNEKVRCDLFEAIIGAIAADSGWDFKQIEKSCKTMWGMLDFEMNAAKKVLDFLHKYQIEQIAGKAMPDTAVQKYYEDDEYYEDYDND